MIGLLVAAFAGWRRWPLWAPIAIALLGMPLALYNWHVAGAWRAEAGLPDLDIAAQMISAALGLALLYLAYAAGHCARLAVVTIKRKLAR